MELDGKPLVRHAVDAAIDAGLAEIVVVLGHEADRVLEALGELPTICRTVINPRFGDGQSSSLAVGLQTASEESQAAVVLLADQPGVSAATVGALVRAFLAGRSRIVRVHYRDGPGPALLSREIWPEATHLRGDTGARVLIASHPDWVELVEVDDDAPIDVDTAEDAERLAQNAGPSRR